MQESFILMRLVSQIDSGVYSFPANFSGFAYLLLDKRQIEL